VELLVKTATLKFLHAQDLVQTAFAKSVTETEPQLESSNGNIIPAAPVLSKMKASKPVQPNQNAVLPDKDWLDTVIKVFSYSNNIFTTAALGESGVSKLRGATAGG
jgi:hypothetical protein